MNERPVDPLLAAIREYVNLRNEADAYLRALLAYGREIAQPRPYRLIDLAEAAGMSVMASGRRMDQRTWRLRES
jgi:hypothetical protein